jgi:lariat debranching enzyme
MASKFIEILEPSDVAYTNSNLNVSLEDILAEEGRIRSDSQSSSSSNGSSSRSDSDSAKSPTDDNKKEDGIHRRFTFKIHRNR